MTDAPVAYTLPKSVGKNDAATRVLSVLFLGMVVASFVGTQAVADRLHYNPSLGVPLTHLRFPYLHSVYQPFAWAGWAWQFNNPMPAAFFHSPQYAPAVRLAVDRVLWSLVYWLGGGLFLSLLVAMSVGLRGKSDSEKVKHAVDSARWADEKTLQEKGFFREAGPIIGGFAKRRGTRTVIVPLRYDGENGLEHIAPPGGAKTTQLKANLLTELQRSDRERIALYGDTEDGRRSDTYGERPSHIALDAKGGDLVRSTSGYQKQSGAKVIVVNLAAESNAGLGSINPLWGIRLGTDYEPAECHDMATALVDADGTARQPYWDSAGMAFGAAVIAVIGYRAMQTGRLLDFSLPGLVRYISSFKPDEPGEPDADESPEKREQKRLREGIENLCHDMMLPHDPHRVFGWVDADGKPTMQVDWIMGATQAMLSKADDERAGVFGSFLEKLGVYRDRILEKHISSSTFSFRQLANQSEPCVLYLSVPAMMLNRYRPFIRVFTRTAIRELTETMGTIDGREVRGNVRAMMFQFDEIATLKRDEEIATTTGWWRGHGLVLNALWQTEDQKLGHYGEHEAITATMGAHIFGRPETERDAERLSKALGKFSFSVTETSRTTGGVSSNNSTRESIQTRDLMSPGEVKELDEDYNIIFSRGLKIKALKYPYWQNPVLAERSRIPPVTESDVLSDRPFFIENLERVIGAERVTKLLSGYVHVVEKPKPKPKAKKKPAIEGTSVVMRHTTDPQEAMRRAEAAILAAVESEVAE